MAAPHYRRVHLKLEGWFLNPEVERVQGVDRAAGVGEFQDCIACGSNNLNWKDMDHCERIEPLSQIVSSSNFEGRHGYASVVFPYNDRLALWVVGGRGIGLSSLPLLLSSDPAFLDVVPRPKSLPHGIDLPLRP